MRLMVYLSPFDDLFNNVFFSDSSHKLFLTRNQNLKYIQLYTGRFDYKNWALPGLGQEAFKNCAEKRCYAFKSSFRQIALENSDGVIVHGPNLYNMPDRTKYKRRRKQIWMYYSMESPRGSYCSMFYKPTHLDDWFNLTATYKQDSRKKNFI